MRGDLQDMLTHVGRRAVEVEVGVVGEVDRARRIDGRGVLHADAQPVFEAVTDRRREISGVALIAIGRFDPEHHVRLALLDDSPAARTESARPAVQLVRWSQSSFPAILPGGVTDSHPLMQPITIPVPAEIAAFEAEVAGRWSKGQYDDIDTDDLGSH